MANPIFTYLSNLIGVPYDQILLVGSVLSAIPIGLINYLIISPKLRLYYGLITGGFVSYSLYGSGNIHPFIGGLFTYLFMKYFGRKKSAFYVFIITFLHLAFLHIYRMLTMYGEWTADDTTSLYMMTICKFSSMAFSYEDGQLDDSKIKNKHWKKYKIKEMPTFLEVMTYTFYFPSAIMGPFFEFMDFKNFIYLQEEYSRLKPLNTIYFSLIELTFVSISTVFYGYFGPKYPLSYCGTKEYGEKSFLYKVLYNFFAMTVHRSKFYTGFLMSFSGLIVCGLAYKETPKDEPVNTFIKKIENDVIITYDKGNYGSIIDCEFGINVKTKITSWNNSVSLWLKYNLFLRCINIENKIFKNNYNLASLITFMISALWHGFYPTYYIFFFVFFIYQTANEKFDKAGLYNWVNSHPNPLIKIPFWLLAQYLVNHLGTIIFNLKYEYFINFMISTKFLPFIIILILFVISLNIKVKKKDKKISEKNENEKNKKKL